MAYVPDMIKQKSWYHDVDCSKQLAEVIIEHNMTGEIENVQLNDEVQLIEQINRIGERL